MNRRTILRGAVVAPAMALAPATATAAPSSSSKYTTVVLAPHQDDETIRLASYVAFAADRGDHLTLVTATNGDATKVGPQLGLSKPQLTRWRDREQDGAWSWLTDGKGQPPIRLGMPDGGASREGVRSELASLLSSLPGTPELYVATWHHDKEGNYIGDRHPDHAACVLAARDIAAANGTVVRFARHPLTPGRGATYAPSAEQLLRIEGAVGAYKVIGMRSAPSQLEAALSNPSTVTR